MALAVGDIIQFTDVQSYLGQTVLNTYTYQVESFESAVTLEDLAQGFELYVATEVATVQDDDVTHPFIIAKNLSNGIDIWEEPTTIAGDNASTLEGTSFMALGYRLVRSNASTRHGSKRIGGLPAGISDGNAINPAYATLVDDLAAVFALPLTATGTVDHDYVLNPVIIGRYPTGDPNAGEMDLSVVNPVSAAQFIRMTTQNTRKAGRGI